MAIGAAGIVWPGQPERAAELAAALGCVSNGRDGIYAGQAVAAAVAVAMVGADPVAMTAAALAHVPPDSWTYRVLERASAAATPVALYEACVVEWYPWADIAPEAVGLAFGALRLAQPDFADIVLTGVNFGRDADTIGAIAGILAGAYLGAPSIPSKWRDRVHEASGVCLGAVAGVNIRTVAERLVAHADAG
jgi:ADP-ribosylglycohydrolase